MTDDDFPVDPHALVVLSRPRGLWVAVCYCNWKSRAAHSRDDALNDHEHHTLTSRAADWVAANG